MARQLSVQLEKLQIEKDEEKTQMEALEDKERELLQELKRMKGVEGKQPTPPTGACYVWSRGIRYDMELGCVGGNTSETLILVAVGSEFPAGVKVQPRVRNPALAKRAVQTYGRLPFIVTGLHDEAAADLMARASPRLKAPNGDLIHLCLDVPGKQRSKEYYLKTIENYLKHCQQPVAALYYLGHSEEGTGNWCFKDGTISFEEIFDLYRRHRAGKMLSMVSDCCYSGHWVRDFAKILDRLGIPPCGHRAREQGILVNIGVSCQSDQKAAEPCHSMEAVNVLADGTLTITAKQMAQQKSAWFNCTRLVCCKGPDSPCPRDTFQHFKWEDGAVKGLPVQQIKRKEGGADKWYYIMLHRADDEYGAAFDAQFKRDPALQLSDWGYVLESGQGKNIPEETQEKVLNWASVAST